MRIKDFKCDADYMEWYRTIGYVAKSKKKGALRGYKEVYELTELKEGAWKEYLDYLLEVSPVNRTLCYLHQGYLDLLKLAKAHNDPDDLEEFKDTVRHEMKFGVPAKLVRRYLKLTWDDVHELNRPKVEMPIVPIEF